MTPGGPNPTESARRNQPERPTLHFPVSDDREPVELPPWPHEPALGFHDGRRPASLMGVVNVTPDSFSDGGRYLDPERAVEHGLALVEEGADVLDIGGESTRPGAAPVDAEEELRRILPVIEGLRARCDTPVSVDTTKAAVARAAVAAGATVVNDVSGGLADPEMLPTVAALRDGVDLFLVLMHRQGTPDAMQQAPAYGDPLEEVRACLEERLLAAEAAGIPRDRLVVDPGIGFGKRLDHNLALLRGLPRLRALGAPLLLGVSRKSFIGHITGAERQAEWRSARAMDRDRVGGTAAAIALAVAGGGVDVLRVHDVAVMREAALVAAAIARAPGTP